MPVISELAIYPIKGARAVSVDQIDVGPTGLKGDREFALFKDGQRGNVKQIPGVMFLEPSWDGTTLVLNHPGRETFRLDTKSLGSPLLEPFRGSHTPVADLGDEVAKWLSLAVGESVRLCRIAEPAPFVIPLPEFMADVHGQEQDRFIDAAPVMLATTDSLDDLNTRLASPVEMGRFRANIVISGLPAYSEDDIGVFQFDQVALKQVAPCERCAVVTMDLHSGDTAKEPLKTLATYRRRANDYAGGVMFGSYLAVASGGTLSVGETLQT